MYDDLADSIFSSENSKTKKTIVNIIIWDFDSVIADTECLWMENRRILLNQKFNLGWDISTTNYYIGGMSWRTRIANIFIMIYEILKNYCFQNNKKASQRRLFFKNSLY